VFFDSLYGGDPIYYQHLFWFFGHPEVYILLLPAFGMISLSLSSMLQVCLFGKCAMILAMSCLWIVGCLVWSHHMFTIGLESDTRSFFVANTLLISLPTASKIFNWLVSYCVSV